MLLPQRSRWWGQPAWDERGKAPSDTQTFPDVTLRVYRRVC